MDYDIVPIGKETLSHVAALLWERNRTCATYVHWKYGQSKGNGSWGFVAVRGSEALGCFGLLPRSLQTASGACIAAGWFADWYVSSQNRGQKVGLTLLQTVSAQFPITFGHPNPPKARQLCALNGYRPIGFQSRRRLLLKPYRYHTYRTRYPVKAAAKTLAAYFLSHEAKFQAASGTADVVPSARFTLESSYRCWMTEQSVRDSVRRQSSIWEEKGLHIVYTTDILETGEISVRVLYSEGDLIHEPKVWAAFSRHVKSLQGMAIELFTTSQSLDGVWARLGAYSVAESPILVCGDYEEQMPLILHGWDRENWTYLAGQ